MKKPNRKIVERGKIDTPIYIYNSLSVTCGRSVVFSLYSTNKTDSNDITDILLKMALSTINQTKQKLVCHNIIDITKISQLYYYLGYTIRYIVLKVSVDFNTQRLTCISGLNETYI
jgi:hypothetical protein